MLSTKSNVASTLLPFVATRFPVLTTMSNEISSFRQSQNKLNMFNMFRICRTDEISFDIVAKNGNNVEATFDSVKRTKFWLILQTGRQIYTWRQEGGRMVDFTIGLNSFFIVAVLATKSNVASTESNVASTLLLVWTGLKVAWRQSQFRSAAWKATAKRQSEGNKMRICSSVRPVWHYSCATRSTLSLRFSAQIVTAFRSM